MQVLCQQQSSINDILMANTRSELSYQQRYILHTQVCWSVVHISRKFTMGKLKYLVSFSIDPRCIFLSVSQGMKQTQLYLQYPLFQVQLDRCDHLGLFSERTKCKVQILEFSFRLSYPKPQSRRKSATYSQKLSAQSIQRKKLYQNWLMHE